MSRSGNLINYSLRPRKNIERKILCDIIRSLSYFGPVDEYRYLGFGSFYYQDYILFHKEFSITQAISFEIDTRGYLKNSKATKCVLNYIYSEWERLNYFQKITEVFAGLRQEISCNDSKACEKRILEEISKRLSEQISSQIRLLNINETELNIVKNSIYDFSISNLADTIVLSSKEVLLDKINKEYKKIVDTLPIAEAGDVVLGNDYEDILRSRISEIEIKISLNKEIVLKQINDSCTNRYICNKPYGFINISFGEIQDWLENIHWTNEIRNIIWLDYDNFIDEGMLDCLEKCILKSAKGSLIIFSASMGNSADERIGNFKENFSDNYRLGGSIEKKMCDNKEIGNTFYNIVKNTVQAAISDKNNYNELGTASFVEKQVLNCQYADGTMMYTYAMIISDLDDDTGSATFPTNIFKKYEWYTPQEERFTIDMPILSNKEISMINRFLPTIDDKEIILNFPYIPAAEIKKYLKIYKYYPNYFDAVHFA